MLKTGKWEQSRLQSQMQFFFRSNGGNEYGVFVCVFIPTFVLIISIAMMLSLGDVLVVSSEMFVQNYKDFMKNFVSFCIEFVSFDCNCRLS